MKEHFAEIEALRAALPDDVYLWVNAFKRIENYYSPQESEFLTQIDALFGFNNQYHESLGRACATGESVISVDGDGTVTRCHFNKTRLGNLYDAEFEAILKPRLCENARCGCHIGYVHLNDLGLGAVFDEGILERIPRF